jgi:predicted membrane-bound spermidine synthase
VSLQINRYYSIEFFRQIDRILRTDGILSLKFAAEGAYLSPEEASLLAVIRNGCRRVFGHVTTVPGDYVHILASPDLDVRTRTDRLAETMALRRLATSFVTQSTITDRLFPLRVAYLDSMMSRYGEGVLNTDARPVSFSHAISLWATHFRSGRVVAAMGRWFDLRKTIIVLVLVGIGLVALHMRIGAVPPASLPAASALYSMGFTTMFTEILIILVFQTMSGYIYTRIAAIVAAFMLGMGLASSLTGRRFESRRALRNLLLPHFGLTLMPLVVIAGLGLARQLSGDLSHHVVDTAFVGMAFVTGGLGGSIFAAASGLLAGTQPGAPETGALAYSLDLTGACVAGFMTGFLIIPSLGFDAAAYSVSLFSLAALAPLAISRMARRRALAR